jgi:hypothetical protein
METIFPPDLPPTMPPGKSIFMALFKRAYIIKSPFEKNQKVFFGGPTSENNVFALLKQAQ